MNAAPTSKALAASRRACARSPSPIACPTSTEAALPTPIGTMNVSDARLIATWWPPIAAAPNQPANTEIAPNVAYSTEFWSPIGSPSRTVCASGPNASAAGRHGRSTGASSRRAPTSRTATMR